jgi:hypothetical protein
LTGINALLENIKSEFARLREEGDMRYPLAAVDPDSCQVVDFTWDSQNAALRFHFVMTIDRAPILARGRR